MKERLQKILAQANAATSRRAAEALIEQRRVRINGEIAKLGDKADPDTDVIQVDGAYVRLERTKKIYIALNKPKHVLTTTEPHKDDDRQTVYDLVGIKENLFSIGRLDADSEGLIVLTNDGDLAQRLTHPRYRHSKTYKVEVDGLPGMDVLDKWRNGVILDEDEKTSPCVVELLEGDKKLSTLRIIMTEGRKRQIRRVGMKLEHRVRRLLRTHIGMLPIGELRPGEWRELSARDLALLKTPAPELRLLRKRQQPARRPAAAAGKPAAEVKVAASPPRPPRRSLRDEVDDEGNLRRPRVRLVDDETMPGERPRRTPNRPNQTGAAPAKSRSRTAQPGAASAEPGSRPARPGAKPGSRPARPGGKPGSRPAGPRDGSRQNSRDDSASGGPGRDDRSSSRPSRPTSRKPKGRP